MAIKVKSKSNFTPTFGTSRVKKNNVVPASASKPRISVNKLGEYLEANSTRRKQIVKDAKYPPKFKTTRYDDARDALKDYIINNQDESIIAKAIESIQAKPNDTEFQEQDNELSVEMLEKVLESNLSILDGYEFKKFGQENKLIEINGVGISIYPDLVLIKNISDVENVGLLKISISKTNELSGECQKIIATLLYKYADNYVAVEPQTANLKMCLSFDVFKGAFECSPSSYSMRMKRIEAACEEIAMWWEKL